MEPLLKKTRCENQEPYYAKEPSSEKEREESEKEEGWWRACDTVPPYQDETGGYWTPLFVDDVDVKEKRYVVLFQNHEQKWTWDDECHAWDENLKPTLTQSSALVYNQMSAFLCADKRNRKIYFVLKKTDNQSDWSFFWKHWLVHYQVWFSSHSKDLPRWTSLIQNANLIQFTNKKRQTSPKFGTMTAPNARNACMRKILQHINADVFFDHLEDVFFLQASQRSEDVITSKPDGELKWNQVLPSNFDASYQGQHVLAMTLITMHKDEHETLTWVEIELLQSFVPHFGVAQRLIAKLHEHFKVPVFPNDVTPNMNYWEKNFHLLLDPCVELAESEFFRFGQQHIQGFETLFDKIYLHEFQGNFSNK